MWGLSGTQWAFLAIISALAGFTLGGAIMNFLSWFYRASREAEQHNKRIEFGAMVAALLALLISAAAFFLALYGRDDLDARITKLEKASALPSGSQVKPDQQGAKP